MKWLKRNQSAIPWCQAALVRLLLPDQRHESNGSYDPGCGHSVGVFCQYHKLLIKVANRDDHAATRPQLRDERLWNVVRRCGHDDGVEWRMLRPTLVSIADFRRDIAVAQTFEVGAGQFAELWYDLDRIHLACEHGQDRRLVARSSAHL